jgi:hypothetical protein
MNHNHVYMIEDALLVLQRLRADIEATFSKYSSSVGRVVVPNAHQLSPSSPSL